MIDRRQHVHAEEAEVVTRPQAGDVSFCSASVGVGFSSTVAISNSLAAADQFSADGAVVGQLALVCRLHRRDRALLGGGDLHELRGARLGDPADAEVVADDQQERLAWMNFPGAPHRVAVSERRRLLDERRGAVRARPRPSGRPLRRLG